MMNYEKMITTTALMINLNRLKIDVFDLTYYLSILYDKDKQKIMEDIMNEIRRLEK